MVPTPNATCDIYRFNNLVNPPDVAGVPCNLKPDFRAGQRAGDRGNTSLTWTHVMLLAMDVDIRDGYSGTNSNNSLADFVYFGPRNTATMYRVVFIEKVDDYKRVYLDRNVPNWPSNDV